MLLSSCLPVFANGVDFSGYIQTQWGLGAPWTNTDTSAGKFLSGKSDFTGKLDVWYGNSSALAQGTVSYDALTTKLDFSFKELWLDYTSSLWGVRIGRQKAVWGKADGIDIANVICPSDLSSISAMIEDETSLPVDALRLSLTGNQYTLDVWWIPFFTPSPLMSGILSQVDGVKKPEFAIWNCEYGIKFSGYFSAMDLSFYGFYGWEDTPIIDYAFVPPSSVTASGEYKKLIMTGADAAVPLGETVLRFEAAFFPQRFFQKKAELVLQEKNTAPEAKAWKKNNNLKALAGFDWMPSDWTITAQYYFDYVFGELDILEREKAYLHGVTLSLSKSFLNDTLELGFSGFLGLNDFDSMINPSISYSLSDQINISAGAYIILPGPDCDGVYGAYKDYSSFYLKAKFSF
jgi:hypothetical protein